MTNIKCKFDSLFFSLYTPEEVRKLSVKEITSSVSIEPTLGKGSINGLYDPKMGPLNEREPCRTCNLSFYECNGHFGHIELPKPIYNPVLFGVLFKFIKGMCFYCHKLLDIQGLQELLYTLGMKELEDRVARFNDIDELKSMCHNELIDKLVKCISQSKKSSKCIHCSKPILLFKKSRSAEILVHVIIKMQNKTDEPLSKKIKLDGFDINKPILSNYESTYTTKELYGGFDKEDVVLLPELLREHLRFLWVNEYDKLKMVLPFLNNSNFKYPTDMFFMENILVNPPMNRVPAIMNGDKMTESPETANLALIINACSALSNLINNRMDNTSDYQYFQNNREGVFELQRRVNICLDATPYKNMNNAQPGLRQKLDKKAGLIRTNINAKRVNSACRSVISPDPEIGLDEVGVPVVFLKKLTFAENMNDLNKEYLRQCIINGPEIYPGATSYQVGDKPLTNIKGNTEITADHLESLMQRGETVVVYRHAMNGDTLIMNRQPTLHKNSMQAHKILAILDESAKTLRMNYSNCKAYNADFDGDEMNGHFMQSIISQTDAKIIANVANQHSTSKDGSPLAGLIQDHVIAGTRLCMRNTFLERHEYFDLVKFGLKDNYTSPMTILPPAIIKPKRLWTGKQVLSTILLNSIPTGYSLPNIVLHEPKKNILWKISKDEEEMKLSDVDLVIVDGYICTGIFDKVHIGPSQKGLCTDLRELYGNEKALVILTNLSRCLNRYLIYTGFSTNLKDGCLNQEAESIRQRISNQMKNVGLTSIIKTFNTNHRNINLDGIVKLMEKAHFDKSDEFNTKMSEMDMNFKCLSNKYMNELALLSKDSLKENFPHNNLLFMANTGAKGGDSNVKKIAVALGAIEIAGQRTPLTLSGKTLPSFVRYDFNPSSRGFCMSRFTSGLKPQELFFESMAGRDGLVDTAVKTSSSGYLQRCLIKSLEDISVRYDGTVRDNMDKIIQFKYGYDGLDVVKSLTMSSVSTMEVICRNLSHFKNKYLSHMKPITIDENTLRKTDRKNIEELIEIMKGEQIHLSKKDKALLNDIVAVKILSSQCEAGEAVGILAAQSIGEPSTQMTLNTFHNVGQSEMNVTLGIPRLREVLMTGSENIKTPSMSVPILDSGCSMDKLLKQFNKLRLKDIIELPLKLKVNANDMKITFNLKKASEFKHLTHLSVHQAVLKIENIFFRILAKTLKKIIESSNIDIKEGKNRENIDEGGKNDESDNDEPVFDSVVEKIGAKEENIGGEVDDGSDSESSDLDDDEKVSETENKDEDNDMDVVEVNISSLELRKNNVISLSPNFINYEVDQINKPTWIRLTIKKINNKMDFNSILLNLINNTLLSETPGVDKAIIMKTKKGDVFCTEGYNNLEVYKHDKLFDLNKFHTNNIVKMSKIYGIEAAISCLIHEMKSVFEPYSIDISSRHMRLIAEYMTFPGHCSAFNRHSMKYHSSQFQRATFETALDSINDMLFKGSVDFLKSPSSNMLLGQVASYLGSNAMDLHYKKSL